MKKMSLTVKTDDVTSDTRDVDNNKNDRNKNSSIEILFNCLNFKGIGHLTPIVQYSSITYLILKENNNK